MRPVGVVVNRLWLELRVVHRHPEYGVLHLGHAGQERILCPDVTLLECTELLGDSLAVYVQSALVAHVPVGFRPGGEVHQILAGQACLFFYVPCAGRVGRHLFLQRALVCAAEYLIEKAHRLFLLLPDSWSSGGRTQRSSLALVLIVPQYDIVRYDLLLTGRPYQSRKRSNCNDYPDSTIQAYPPDAATGANVMGHKPFQELRDKMKDHREIWLEPRPIPPAPQDDRTWRQNNEYEGRKATRYIRADLHDTIEIFQLFERQISDTKTITELEVKLVKAQQKCNEYFVKMLEWQEKAMGQYRPGWDE